MDLSTEPTANSIPFYVWLISKYHNKNHEIKVQLNVLLQKICYFWIPFIFQDNYKPPKSIRQMQNLSITSTFNSEIFKCHFYLLFSDKILMDFFGGVRLRCFYKYLLDFVIQMLHCVPNHTIPGNWTIHAANWIPQSESFINNAH